MLSNPSLMSSAGKKAAASTSMSKSSLMEAAYSARFRRCSWMFPGFGFAAAAWSSDVSSHVIRDCAAAGSGCRAFGGGMRWPRIFMIAFSQISAF